MDQPTQDKPLTAKDVAALAGVDQSTVRRWTMAGHIAAQKNPGAKGAYRYSASEVDRFLQSLRTVVAS